MSFTVHQGDCLHLMKKIPDASVPLVICDLPYCQTDASYDQDGVDLAQLWSEYERILTPNGAVLLFGQGRFAAELALSSRLFRYELIWDKVYVTGFQNAARMPMRRHETILVFYRRLPVYDPPGVTLSGRTQAKSTPSEVWGEMRGVLSQPSRTGWPQSILRYPREQNCQPFEKPKALLEFLIRTYSRPGDTVLDNTMGLGNTGVAAARASRSFIGFEIDKTRFNRAKARVEAAYAEAAEGTSAAA